jgi:para-nitrobenzyl esterase
MSDLTADFRLHHRGLLLASAAFAATPALGLAQGDRPIANTRAGQIAGRNVGGVKVFKGIPYGADKTGSRLQPPRSASA